MFTTDIYVQIGIDRIRVKNVISGQTIERIPEIPFSHPRMLIGNFTQADVLVRAAVSEVKGFGFLKSLRIVIHPTELVSGGLSQVEERAIHELAVGTGAKKVVVWVGAELSDDAVKARL